MFLVPHSQLVIKFISQKKWWGGLATQISFGNKKIFFVTCHVFLFLTCKKGVLKMER